MNNEPVAWIAYDEFGDFMLEATPEGDYPWKPLYTHPAKTDKYIADLKNLVDAQGQDGTWNSNQYMLGLFNGLELALSIFESREPKFRALTAKILTHEEIIGAIAKGWCSEKNSSKTMDSDLAMAIADEIKAILRKAQEK